MPIYNVTNTRGDVVATIGVSTTTGGSYPIELLGQAISLYGPIIASNQYKLMENFADDQFLDIANPLMSIPEGLMQYRTDQKVPYLYDGSNWIRVATGLSSSGVLFSMAPAAENMDFAVETTYEIFAPSVAGFKYYPSGILLLPTDVSSPAGDAVFKMWVEDQDPPNGPDVLEDVPVINPTADQHVSYPLSGKIRTVDATAGDTVKLEVTQAITGGSLKYDALMFGFITA